MEAITLRTLDGQTAPVTDRHFVGLRARMIGELIAPGEEGYDSARTLWNAMIDRRPGLIARCANAEDVAAAMGFARDTGALVSVKGGGHNIAGNAVSDGGLTIDLSAMNRVGVDPQTRLVSVEPGATLADLDAATAPHGLAVPTGINSTTGIAGLTLGGGFGWLTRAHGLTIDSLLSAEIVTAAGERIRASADEHPDLFWALRGGGGNFGIVTRFEFEAKPVRPDLLSGLIVLPLARAREALTLQRDLLRTAPDDLTVWAVLRNAPPLPFLPEEAHGTGVAILAFCWAGDPEEGADAIAPLRAIPDPIGAVAGVQPFAQWQQAFDPLLTTGARNYWKSHDLLEMSDGAVEMLIDAAGRLPSDECEVFVAQLGGAMSRITPDATAFVQRRPHFAVNVHTRWRDAAQDETCVAWARGLFEALKPHSAGVYVNFMPADETARVAEAYGPNFARLAAIKAIYDPENRFRLNQNIAPAEPARLAG
jgi:FAD/FMN-containing dehydrogenase